MKKLIGFDLNREDVDLIRKLLTNAVNTSTSEIEVINSKHILAKLVNLKEAQEELKFDYKALFEVVSMAKSEFTRLPSEVYLSNKKCEEWELTHIALAISLIMWLNKEIALKKSVEFDFTDNSNQFEELDE
jgi:predicted nuclease with TOPRIM domain